MKDEKKFSLEFIMHLGAEETIDFAFPISSFVSQDSHPNERRAGQQTTGAECRDTGPVQTLLSRQKLNSGGCAGRLDVNSLVLAVLGGRTGSTGRLCIAPAPLGHVLPSPSCGKGRVMIQRGFLLC